MAKLTLSGITWDHTRGYVPMVATAQRWGETHPDVEIVWHKRSLQAFADYPIEELATRFDLLVIDHPFAGYAAAHGVLVPLDEYLPAAFLADQAANTVGLSHASYSYGGHHWALAIDAATPVSAYRPDLLERAGVDVPHSWDDLLALARRGLVALPAIPVDSLMHWYMLCCALGEEPFSTSGRVVDEDVGIEALERMRELVQLCDPACLMRNPIATYEALAAGDTLAYCPFAYGYSNYARPGYAPHTLRFGGLVFYGGRALRSTLGGTGLAVSHSSRFVEQAVDYARFVAEPEQQRGMFFAAGGQPGHRAAWRDHEVNAASGGFFADTLPTLDDAYLRPRYAGYLHVQDRAGRVVHDYFARGGDPRTALAALETIRRDFPEPT